MAIHSQLTHTLYGWQQAKDSSEVEETWTYASADSPTFTFTIAGVDLTGKYTLGTRLKLTQSTGGTKYFIVTKVAFSTDTTVTIYGGTDYTLNNEAISAPYFSRDKSPAGFPLDPAKWTVETSDTSNRSQASPTNNTWYNLGSVSISIPIGVWNVRYEVLAQINSTAAQTGASVVTTLSTANNTESDISMSAMAFNGGASGTLTVIQLANRSRVIALTSKTSYFLNTETTTNNADTIFNRGDIGTTKIRAICAYL